MDEDASLNDYWAEVFNCQWDMERHAEFQWLCERTQMPCVSVNQWLQLGRYRQHVLMRSGEFSEPALWEGGGLTMSHLMWWHTFCYDNATLRECALRVCSVVSVA